MKKIISSVLVAVLLCTGVFVLTGCEEKKAENNTTANSANVEKYTINASYGGEFSFEFPKDLGYEAKEEKNTMIFTHTENKSTIKIYTMDTSTTSIIMKEKDFSASAYTGYKEIEINGHKAYTIAKTNNFAVIYGIQLEKDERDPNTNYKYYGVKVEVSKNSLKLDQFDPAAFVQTEAFQNFLNSIKVTPAPVESAQ